MGAAQQLLIYPAAAGGGGTDPSFSSVVVLCHFDGTNGSQTFTNEVAGGIVVSALNANQVISTAQSVFGGASLRIPSGYAGNEEAFGNASLAFAAGDFCIELRYRPDSTAGAGVIYDGRIGEGAYPAIYTAGSDLRFYVASADRITSGSVLAANTWCAIAVARVSGTTRMFVNGAQVGSNYTDGNSYVNARLRLGLSSTNTASAAGYYEELRVTKGVGRYSGNYTIAAAAFPNS